MDLFDFQFWKIIFLVTTIEMSDEFLYLSGRDICAISPNRHSDGDIGILQPRTVENSSVTVVQKA